MPVVVRACPTIIVVLQQLQQQTQGWTDLTLVTTEVTILIVRMRTARTLTHSSQFTSVCPDVLNLNERGAPPVATVQPCFDFDSGGRVVSSANISSTMATAVETVLNASKPDTVEMNEQGDVILPADFFPESFVKKGGKSAAQAEREFFAKAYTTTILF